MRVLNLVQLYVENGTKFISSELNLPVVHLRLAGTCTKFRSLPTGTGIASNRLKHQVSNRTRVPVLQSTIILQSIIK